MKKAIIFLLTALTVFSCAFSLPVSALYNEDVTVINEKKEKVPYKIQTPRYYVESLDTGAVLFAKNETESSVSSSIHAAAPPFFL